VARFWGTLGGILAGLRGFTRALKRHRPRTPIPTPRPAASAEGRELPVSYGRPKVTLMVVDPYLVYAYWDVDTERLPAGTQSAVLRFHDASQAAPPFDVDIDLRALNWYVHLWSPAKSYYADLGVRTEGGQFISLAVSNRIETPRAWPAAEIKEVGQALSPADAGEARAPVAPSPAARAEAHMLSPAVLAPPKQPAPAARNPQPEAKSLEPEVRESVPKPVHAGDVLRQRLAEIYALRSWQSRPALTLAAVSPGEIVGTTFTLQPAGAETICAIHVPGERAPSAFTPVPSDLTALAERGFSPGLPSSPGAPAG